MRTRMLAAATAAVLSIASTPMTAASANPTPTRSIGGRFSVAVEGRGPDVILIPGLASARSIWMATAQRLRATHRVHLVQLAGFAGEPTGANAGGPVVAPFVEQLARYIAEAKLKAPIVIGHSLGGEAALMLAARHPGSVGRVMVVDALPFYSLIVDPTATPASIAPRAAAMRDAMLSADPAQAEAMQAGVIARLVKTPEARPALVSAGLASDRGTVARATYELMTTDLRPELGRITAPVTIVYAYHPVYGVPSATIDALYRSAYSTHPNTTFRRIDDSYHFVMLDQPARFSEAVEAFLKP